MQQDIEIRETIAIQQLRREGMRMRTEITATFQRSLINTHNDELYTAVRQSVPLDHRISPLACMPFIYRAKILEI